MGFFIFGQLASLCEIIIVLWFLIKFLKWKDEIICRKAVVTGMCALLLLIAQMNGRFNSSYIVVIVLDVLILIGFCRIALKGTLPIQMLGCITPFLIVEIGNILIMQIMALHRRIDVQGYMKSQGVSFVVGVILSKLLLGASLYWLQKKFNGKSISLSKKYYRIINAVCIYMVIMELLLYYVANMGVYHKKANVLLEIIAVGMAIMTIYIGYSVYIISKKNVELARLEVLELQNQEKERRLQEIKRAEFRENQLIHDYKNHCVCIQNLIEKEHYKEAEKYLAGILNKYVQNQREFVQTNNETLDALLNTKIAYCEENGIPIHCVILGAMAKFENMEFMIILFNLLDNAIEASEDMEKEDRSIEVELYHREKSVELFVKNNISDSVLLKNPKLLSGKGQEGHGIGHQSVEVSVEELSGIMEYYEEDGQFCAHVFIPVSIE